MKKIALLIISVFYLLNSFSQEQEAKLEAPNYKEISKQIKNKKSKFYYPNLMNRYLNGDTHFDLDEKRHLYYGYSFQDSYSPYGSSDYSDSLKIVFNKDTLVETDYNDIIRFSSMILDENPFHLIALRNLSFSYYKLNTNPKLKELYSYKSELIYDAIFSSGDGISEKTAFYVINISDEYRILNILDFEFGGQQQLLKSRYDYLKVQENEAGIDGLYFEISRSLSHMKQMFK